MDKLWYTHAMEYYRVPYGTKKEQNSNTCNNMDESPKKTMLGEISQAQKSMYCDSISMKLQKSQNHSDKADQWLPREEGREYKGARENYLGWGNYSTTWLW